MPKTTCTYHCQSCGTHFHSLEAFDAHRQGDHASNDPELGRHCVHPFDLAGRLTPLTEDGECRISHGDVKRGVTIWATARQIGRRPWKTPHSVSVKPRERSDA
jgi:hypothetical protein